MSEEDDVWEPMTTKEQAKVLTIYVLAFVVLVSVVFLPFVL